MVLVALLSLALLPGCESVFGKEEGTRGALPGKRENVFSTERSLKSDATAGADAAEITVPEMRDRAEWTGPGGGAPRAYGNLALSMPVTRVWSSSIGEGADDKKALIAQPVVAEGKIFAIDSAAAVIALNAGDGAPLWRAQIPDPPVDDEDLNGSGLAYADGKIVATTSYGHVAALDAESGKILWQKQLPAPVRAAPAVDETHAYVTTTGNVVYSLSLADGAIGWRRAGVEENAALLGMAAPLPEGEIVVVPFSSGQLLGLRKLNGGTVWEENMARAVPAEGSLPAMSDIQGQLLLANRKLYAASHSGRMVALNPFTGRRLWESDAGSTSMPWLAGGTLYVLTVENQLAALSADDGRVIWVTDLPRYVDPDNRTDPVLWTGPLMAGGQLWIASSRGELRGVNPGNGKETASIDAGAPVYVPMLAAGGALYVLEDDGTLSAYR